jgi:hypothetical protein
MGLTMIKLKVSHQNIQNKGGMNSSNSLVMKIIVWIWLVNGTFSNVPLGTMIFILNIIGRWNDHQISLVHEGKDFWLEKKISTSFHWPKEINSKGGGGGVQVRGTMEFETFLFVWCVKCYMCFKRSVKNKNQLDMYKCVLFMSTMTCANKKGMEENST